MEELAKLFEEQARIFEEQLAVSGDAMQGVSGNAANVPAEGTSDASQHEQQLVVPPTLSSAPQQVEAATLYQTILHELRKMRHVFQQTEAKLAAAGTRITELETWMVDFSLDKLAEDAPKYGTALVKLKNRNEEARDLCERLVEWLLTREYRRKEEDEGDVNDVPGSD